MARLNIKKIEQAKDKIKAGAEEMIKTPIWMIEQILLKHEKAVLETMWEMQWEMQQEIDRLRAAIQQTLDENGHLADGNNCTLILLKRAMEKK